MSYIYALRDPRTRHIRYVGQTINNPKRRATLTTAGTAMPAKRAWLAELKAAGVRPDLMVLEETPDSERKERERWWIGEMTRRGEPLLNVGSEELASAGLASRIVTLPPDVIKYMERLGHGNISAGIREAYRQITGEEAKSEGGE